MEISKLVYLFDTVVSIKICICLSIGISSQHIPTQDVLHCFSVNLDNLFGMIKNDNYETLSR